MTTQDAIRKIWYFVYRRIMGGHLLCLVGMRRFLLRQMLGQGLEGLVVQPNVLIVGYERLKLGRHVSINHNCFLYCQGGLEIGDHVSIAHGTTIMTTEHTYSDAAIPIKHQPMRTESVRLGSNIWIGAKATVLAGVSIADGTIVAAGAVVTKTIDCPDTIVGGVPARFIKSRFGNERVGQIGTGGATEG